MLQKLMALEWMKMRKYKAFWIMLGLFVLGFFGLVYIMYAINNEAPTEMIGSFLDSFFRYPRIARLTAYMGSYMFIVLGIVLITQIANEFSYRTHRQNIIDGLSRTQFINAKWQIVVLLSVFATLVHVGFTALYALMGDGGTVSGFVSSLKYSLFFFLDSLSWLSVALIITLWVKRSGLAITLFMVYALVVENSLAFGIKRSFESNLGEYFPINVADNLNPNVLAPFVNNSRPTEEIAVAVTCVYLVAFYIISRRMIKRMDLK
ncbi:MAG: ABC transporter permease [Prevotellaceae bacterium]|jgi:ABC-type transport system involved in multi-copper enzyme maturation permease subunit|nr:ABC transporter permease [Prevotellaceae bacterium]